MERILITGGAGFIGSRLSLKLSNLGFTVTALDNLSPQIHGNDPIRTSSTYKMLIDAGVTFMHGTVFNRENWISALLRQDAVIHLAAETGTGQSMYEIQKYIDVNVSGTSLLLDILTNHEHDVKKIVVASSRAIYGEGKYDCEEHGIVYPDARREEDMISGKFECTCPLCREPLTLLPTDELSKICPTSVYGITKRTQEEMVLTVGRSLGVPAVAFRYQNVFGPGQSLSNPYTGILSIFSTQIRNGNNINVFEDGRESRDFVYVDDVVDATILGLLKEEANYEAFNVGSGKPTDVLTIANLLKKNYRSAIDIAVTGNYRLGDIRHNFADLTKIRNRLGFSPEFSFEDGLRKFCSWVERENVPEDRYNISIHEMKLKGLYK